MSRVRQLIFCLAAVVAAVAAQAQPAGPVPTRPSITLTNLIPPPPQSPVVFFRQLLQMSPAERNKSLADRLPQARAHITAKVREYLALNPDERELRLRATELRWYLMPLLQMSPTNRTVRLAQVPPELQRLVQVRLSEWDVLPPRLQQEFLANDKTLNYVAHVETPNPPSPDPQQQKIADQVNQFFDLTPGEKRKLLGTLSDSERTQMEKTLTTFDGLPAQQRALCIRNYAKFAGMSDGERAEFLKNAESWSKLSPQERQAWRDLVARIPMWPPMPQVPSHTVPQITTAGSPAN
ncbi:MAG TPA: DUF3106 domain-containing protein [Verrucomicrobiae bacterium]|jgi:hypothetical protein|nr:DUF3106 domain-containing protein [Verrucomicrobiae bacterium]